MSKFLVLKTVALAGDGTSAMFEEVGDGYTEAPGPGEAIMAAVGTKGAYSGEYRAYPVDGSAVLGVDLRVTGIEESGQRASAPQSSEETASA
jgi:hypothetical protein